MCVECVLPPPGPRASRACPAPPGRDDDDCLDDDFPFNRTVVGLKVRADDCYGGHHLRVRHGGVS